MRIQRGSEVEAAGEGQLPRVGVAGTTLCAEQPSLAVKVAAF